MNRATTRGPVRVLLQTTIPATADDWSIARFSLLGQFLRGQKDSSGRPLFDLTMRDRDRPGSPDSVLSTLDRSDFDQMWLFAVDTGDGLTEQDCAAISRFRRNGRGLMVTRDHMDLGSSICALGGIGAAHHFHTRNLDPDVTRRARLMIPTQGIFPGRIFIPAPTETINTSKSSHRFIRCLQIHRRPRARSDFYPPILTKALSARPRIKALAS